MPDPSEGEQVLLRQIGDAPPGVDADATTRTAKPTVCPTIPGRAPARPSSSSHVPHAVVTHQGVLENPGTGGSELQVQADREDGRSRERSRRHDRPRKPSLGHGVTANEPKKPKLEHASEPGNVPEDELMGASSRGPTSPPKSRCTDVFDLTQADLDSADGETSKSKAPDQSNLGA